LLVPLRHAPEKFLHGASLVEIGVAVAHHLLHQIGEADGKVFNLLVGAKGETFPLVAETLERGTAHSVAPNTPGLHCLPGELGGGLVGNGGADLCRNGGAECLQSAAILLVVDVIAGDGVLEEARLELHLHEETPLVVVGAREHRPSGPDLTVDLHDRRTPATPWWRRRSAVAAILRRDGALRILVTSQLLLLLQGRSGFHRGLGRGRCILGCLRRLSRRCLRGLKALPACLHGGGVLTGPPGAPGTGGGHGGGGAGRESTRTLGS